LEILNNLVIVSDIHGGCKLAVCPPEGVALDDGGRYMPSTFQLKLYAYWREFWDEFVPEATRGEVYGIVCNGDAVEGVHHRATTPISQNIIDQCRVTRALLEPEVERAKGGFWAIRGTEAHVGISAQTEEGMFAGLGAIPNAEGQYARWDLWKTIGDDRLVHSLHHVGTTSSMAYESTAPHKELTEMLIEAARWGQRIPDVVARGHRHRAYEEAIATERGRSYIICTPCWQGKTPFAYKIAGARISMPQFGGAVVRYAHGELFVRMYVRTVARSPVE
jgi:hypothetical protein